MAQRKSRSSSVMLLLKVVVVLLCVHGGQSRRLTSGIGQKLETASLTVDQNGRTAAAAEDQTSVDPSALARARRSTLDSSCSLRSILLQVRDLGLGYDSDETVLFKYCSGACPRLTSNHDLTLANLLHSGVLPPLVPGELWHHALCCRPTHHEDMAFLDNSHRWHKVEKLSAAGCSCVG